jgi:hypothetical protein
LTIVIERLSIDYQISRRGKWRPSARALELGGEAIELDTLLHRDGLSAHEAVQTLLVRKSSVLSEERLLEVARAGRSSGSFPPRCPREKEPRPTGS